MRDPNLEPKFMRDTVFAPGWVFGAHSAEQVDVGARDPRPARPKPAKSDPQDAVDRLEPGTPPAAQVGTKLLAQRGVLERELGT